MGMIYLLSHTQKKGVKHIKIIDINFLHPNMGHEDFDALIFTSKNAVKALNELDFPWQNIPAFTIGEATTNEVLNLHGKVKYTSKTSHGDEFAKEIKPLLHNKKILFPRAKKTVSNIKEILSSSHVKEVIVYETLCKTCQTIEKPPSNSTLIFTSPSTIKCFLRCFTWDKSYKVICIGKKTANYLPKSTPYKIPQTQSIDECIELAKQSQIIQ